MDSVWKRRSQIVAFSTVLLSAATGSTSAQDLFGGPYISGALGTSSTDGLIDAPLLSGGTSVQESDISGGNSFGLSGGYFFRRDALVYGFEAGYMSLTGLGSSAQTGQESTEVSDLVDLKARLGYAQGEWLFYGSLGWTFAHVHVHPGGLFGSRPNTTIIDGASVGVGVEYMMSEELSLGVDYTRRSLSGNFDEATSETDLDVNTLVLRLAYRF